MHEEALKKSMQANWEVITGFKTMMGSKDPADSDISVWLPKLDRCC